MNHLTKLNANREQASMKTIIELYGKQTEVNVLIVRRYSMDVERISDGKCFRVSGIYNKGCEL